MAVWEYSNLCDTGGGGVQSRHLGPICCSHI